MGFDKKLSVIFEGLEDGWEIIDQDKANEILKTDASEFKPQQLTYTFIDVDDVENAEYLLLDPNKRELNYSGEYHAIIMDRLKKWDEFPKRGNSIVSYANESKNKEGDAYVVIPLNGNKIGICGKRDILKSFPYVAINLGVKFENFDTSLNLLLNVFNNPEGTYEDRAKKITKENLLRYDTDYPTFRDAIDHVDASFFDEEGKVIVDEMLANPFNKEAEGDLISLVEYMSSKELKLVNILDKLFDPFENGFQILSFKNFILGENKDREIWQDGKCLLVKETAFNNIVIPDGSEEEEVTNDEPEDQEDDEGVGSGEDEVDVNEPVDNGDDEPEDEFADEPVDDEPESESE